MPSGRNPAALCCPDSDWLWFPGGVNEALKWLIRRGHDDANARTIYRAIASGSEAYQLCWDYADVKAREKYAAAVA